MEQIRFKPDLDIGDMKQQCGLMCRYITK